MLYVVLLACLCRIAVWRNSEIMISIISITVSSWLHSIACAISTAVRRQQQWLCSNMQCSAVPPSSTLA